MPDPPSFDRWIVFCESCKAERTVNRMKERDVLTGEVYYDYVCAECASIVLVVTAANPSEREKQLPGTAPN